MAGFCSQDLYIPRSPEVRLPCYQEKQETAFGNIKLRSTDEVPPKYRHVFSETPYFNVVQSKVLDDVLYTDNSLVVCAPTGSGKTMIFELAIVRMLLKADEYGQPHSQQKVVYMAPIKALCAQRYDEWAQKFAATGMQCAQLTGDSNNDDFLLLEKANIILTTPEKWDSTTRRWHDNQSLVNQIKLFLIDEVHMLGDETRGATMEAVVSRMKTKHAYMSLKCRSEYNPGLRFAAVSATIPNVEDIAAWLGTRQSPAVHFSIGEHMRPVKLQLVVLGYPCYTNSEFKFDVNLNYKIADVINTYSEGKPALIFCSTRKSAEQAAVKVSNSSRFVANATHKALLSQIANLVRCHKLRDCLLCGIGYHHAGLDIHDRQLIEKGFTSGHIPVLFSTSTLALGVNLPAHLVIVKSTYHYVNGICEEYSQSEIMQMIGRAGRPQFDTSATAVIMTKEKNRMYYQTITSGKKQIESSLHSHLIEHLNAEIALSTIHDFSFAIEWIRSTFLYIRVMKNPTYYGYTAGSSTKEIEQRLHELCVSRIEALSSEGLVTISSAYDPRLLQSTSSGRLMAQYCIAFKTMVEFSHMKGCQSLEALVTFISKCREFQDLTLRMNERNALNKLNINKTAATIRFSMPGKIKTTQMKVNCLLQATLGNLTIQDFGLQQDITKIFRTASRVSRCLLEYQMLQNDFETLLNAARLAKCIKARMWENSRYVCKQLPGIGPVLATALANGGVRCFQSVAERNPRELELIVNRHPPFGNQMQDAVKHLPQYNMWMEECDNKPFGTASFKIFVSLVNAEMLKKKQTIFGKHMTLLVAGDSNNNVLLKQRIADAHLLNSVWSRIVHVGQVSRKYELKLVLSSQDWVGLDIEHTYTPFQNSAFLDTPTMKTPEDQTSSYFAKKKTESSLVKSWKRPAEENESEKRKSSKFARRRLTLDSSSNAGYLDSKGRKRPNEKYVSKDFVCDFDRDANPDSYTENDLSKATPFSFTVGRQPPVVKQNTRKRTFKYVKGRGASYDHASPKVSPCEEDPDADTAVLEFLNSEEKYIPSSSDKVPVTTLSGEGALRAGSTNDYRSRIGTLPDPWDELEMETCFSTKPDSHYPALQDINWSPLVSDSECVDEIADSIGDISQHDIPSTSAQANVKASDEDPDSSGDYCTTTSSSTFQLCGKSPMWKPFRVLWGSENPSSWSSHDLGNDCQDVEFLEPTKESEVMVVGGEKVH